MSATIRSSARPNEDATPWYRQKWPWILIGIPGTSVVLGFMLLYFAITTADGLVVDDYYRQGRAIDQTMARSLLAGDLGLVADISVRSERVSVQLSANDVTGLPESLIVTIIHPTRAGMDQVLRLAGTAGEYSGPVAPLAIGYWRIQIEDESRSWRLNGAVNLPAETEKRILPYDS
jgi:hypothetical protein